MPRKAKKRKKKEPADQTYIIEVVDWEFDYLFGINNFKSDVISGDYLDCTTLILLGKIISPTLKNIRQVGIRISENPGLDDHWHKEIVVRPAIGWIEILRGNDVLEMNCEVPSRSFKSISIAVASKKVRFATIVGTELKWRKGKIFQVILSTTHPDAAKYSHDIE